LQSTETGAWAWTSAWLPAAAALLSFESNCPPPVSAAWAPPAAGVVTPSSTLVML